MTINYSDAEMLAKLEAAESGSGASNTGLSWEVLSLVFIKRNLDNVPVKTCAEIIGRSHSRVTEIASGRDWKRYSVEDRKAFAAAIEARYNARGLSYTGDYIKSHTTKKWKPPVTPTK